MALIARKQTAAAPAASAPASAPAEAPAASAPAAEAPAEAPAVSTAVAARPANAVGAALPVNADVIGETFKNKVFLEWNTLPRIQALQGNFLNLEKSKAVIGPRIVGQLISYQDNWQISPGVDDAEAAEHVRYSDDGKVTTKGEDCNAYLQALIEAGYTEAKKTQRCTMALAVEDVPGKPGHDLIGELVQIDLPQTSKQSWDRFRLTAAFKATRGMIPVDQLALGRIELEAALVSKGKNTWTVVNFALAK